MTLIATMGPRVIQIGLIDISISIIKNQIESEVEN